MSVNELHAAYGDHDSVHACTGYLTSTSQSSITESLSKGRKNYRRPTVVVVKEDKEKLKLNTLFALRVCVCVRSCLKACVKQTSVTYVCKT